MGLRGGLGSSLIVHSLSSLVRFIWASGTGAPALLLALRLNWGTGHKSRRECWDVIVTSLRELLLDSGIEAGPIEPATMLHSELGITSVDAIHLLLMLEDRFNHPFSFEKLGVRDGEYVQDLSAGEVHDFICSSMNIPEEIEKVERGASAPK